MLIVTHGMTADLLMQGQLSFLSENGFDVLVVSSPGQELNRVATRENCTTFGIRMERRISPWRDFKSFLELLLLIRRVRPHVVNAGTPKAGLLGMMAACLLRVPVRIYTLRGLPLETQRGTFKRLVLKATEMIAASCAHRVVSVSRSLREEYLRLRMTGPEKICVLGPGTSNGVAVVHPKEQNIKSRDMRLPEGELPLIGFVGRLTQDKGITDLVEAFKLLHSTNPSARLVLIGAMEEGDPLTVGTVDAIRSDPAIHHIGWVSDPGDFYPSFRVLGFPSYREGFPNAPLEAASHAVPTVGYRVTGTMDAVIDGVTGLLVEKGDVPGLAASLRRYVENPDLATQHGRSARNRVIEEFERQKVWRRWVSFYQDSVRHLMYHL